MRDEEGPALSIEPEKKIMLTVIYADQVDTVLNEIVPGRGAKRHRPRNRVPPLCRQIAGVVHFMRQRPEKE